MTVQEMAAANNAAWCDVVRRSHGAHTNFDQDAWTSQTRTPYYPDAVTLVRDPSVANLLTRIDDSAGCSIKDSFASIDLRAHGFRVLFDAAPRVGASPPGWELLRDPDVLAEWESAWRGGVVPL